MKRVFSLNYLLILPPSCLVFAANCFDWLEAPKPISNLQESSMLAEKWSIIRKTAILFISLKNFFIASASFELVLFVAILIVQ